MQSVFFTALVASASFFPLSVGQTSVDDVSDDTKEYWCQSQVASCPLLCGDLEKGTQENECYPENLFYTCTCTGGIAPNLTQYSQTIPYFQCTIELNACTEGCNGDPACNNQCPKTHKCGATAPKKPNKTSTASSTASKTALPDSSSTGSSDDSDDDDDSGFASADGSSNNDSNNDSNGAAGLAISIGKTYGLGLVAVAIGGAFIGL